jgi:hypothetical protein
MITKKNPQNATKVNVRAANKKFAKITADLRAVKADIKVINKVLGIRTTKKPTAIDDPDEGVNDD